MPTISRTPVGEVYVKPRNTSSPCFDSATVRTPVGRCYTRPAYSRSYNYGYSTPCRSGLFNSHAYRQPVRVYSDPYVYSNVSYHSPAADGAFIALSAAVGAIWWALWAATTPRVYYY